MPDTYEFNFDQSNQFSSDQKSEEKKTAKNVSEKTKKLESSVITGFSAAFAGINKEKILKGVGDTVDKAKTLATGLMNDDQKKKVDNAKKAYDTAAVTSKFVAENKEAV